MINKKTAKNRNVFALVLALLFSSFIFTRIMQGFSYLIPYFREVVNMVTTRQRVGYDERMFQIMGERYSYIKQIRDITSENAVICFWDGDPILRSISTAYFLYPRSARTIKLSENPLPEIGKNNGCSNVFVHDNFPSFEIKAYGIVILNGDLYGKPDFLDLKGDIYRPALFKGKVGVLEI